VPQKPDTYDFNHLTGRDLLENPELFYQKPEHIPCFTITRIAHTKEAEIMHVCFSSPVRTKFESNNTTYGLYYKTPEKRKPVTAILLHGWGRQNLWKEKKIATGLARHNINCFILKLPYHFERAPEGTCSGEYAITGDIIRTVEGTQQVVTEVRTITSWLKMQGEKVVLAGISLGGMMAHLAMAVETFDAGITILAGGNNAGIIWDGIATKNVKTDLLSAGFTREQTSRAYQIINPTTLAKHNKTKNLLMINGLYDEIIPAQYTRELWEALGRPKILWYPCAHVSILFFTKTLIKHLVQFIREHI
jgi:dienelactone hydrolase